MGVNSEAGSLLDKITVLPELTDKAAGKAAGKAAAKLAAKQALRVGSKFVPGLNAASIVFDILQAAAGVGGAYFDQRAARKYAAGTYGQRLLGPDGKMHSATSLGRGAEFGEGYRTAQYQKNLDKAVRAVTGGLIGAKRDVELSKLRTPPTAEDLLTDAKMLAGADDSKWSSMSPREKAEMLEIARRQSRSEYEGALRSAGGYDYSRARGYQ